VRHAVCLLALAGCGFSSPKPGADPGSGSDVDWWDPAYRHRQRIEVTASAVRPDKGYAGYTARVAPIDPATLTGLSPSCDDLRVVAFDGERWSERPRHLLGCGTGALDLRFSLPVDLADGATWRDAYLYYDREKPPAPPAATGTAVYLWWDDASADLSGECQRGRMDAWNGTNHRDSITWSAGVYGFDTADDGQESLRRAVNERDVLVEAEWRHTGCYNNNMQSGMCARVQIKSGTAASELADHYYCSSRGQNPTCNNNDQGIYDGDIVKTDNEMIALQGKIDPPAIVRDQWRKQALAVFGAGPTHLRFWDADASWPELATPPADALQATGEDATQDHTGRGAAGVMITQDIGSFRNLVIRRYVEPEPATAVRDEEQAP
jgi:hypothetical protein